MRMLTFIKKELIDMLASPELFMLMVLFPIALTWVLGTAFSGGHDIELDLEPIPVVSHQELAQAWIEAGKSGGLDFYIAPQTEVEQQMKAGDIHHYVVIDERTIRYFHDSSDEYAPLMIKALGQSFADRSSRRLYAARHGAADVAGPKTRVRMTSLVPQKSPDSFGYYGVTMLTMIIMYGALQAIGFLTSERANGTYVRLKVSNFSMNLVFVAKIISAVLVMLLQVSILMLFSHLIYGVYYNNLAVVILFLIPFVFFTSAMGIFIYQLTKSDASASVIVNILIILFVFSGGGYIQFRANSPFAQLQNFSPVGWANQGLFEYIYRGNWLPGVRASLLFGLITLVLLAISYFLFTIEEGSDYVSSY